MLIKISISFYQLICLTNASYLTGFERSREWETVDTTTLTKRLFLLFFLLTIQWRRKWHPLQYSSLENPTDRGAWWAAVHGVAQSLTQLSYFTFTFHLHALEKEMETHSSVLAWRIPGTGEPSGLPSMGLQSRTQLKRLSSSNHPIPLKAALKTFLFYAK